MTVEQVPYGVANAMYGSTADPDAHITTLAAESAATRTAVSNVLNALVAMMRGSAAEGGFPDANTIPPAIMATIEEEINWIVGEL